MKNWKYGLLCMSILVLGACQSPTTEKVDTQSSQSETTKEKKIVDNHSHHSHEKKPHQKGIFEDNQVKDRELTDWKGEWQSVYPYVATGQLDEVFKHKAEHKKDKTAQEYKDYYETGYKTDVERIVFDGNQGTFVTQGKEEKATYTYEGYKILTYKSGKRGVRYLFTAKESDTKAPKYIQFSDHEIAPTQAEHFHIYAGNTSHEQLLEELTNWPTYYPADLSVSDIVHEMIYH